MDVNELFEELQNFDQDDLKKIGTAPLAIRIIAGVLVCALVAGSIAYFMVKPAMKQLKVAEQKEKELRQQFETMQSKAVNIDAYKAQLEEMRRSFGAMLRQLPDKTDVESLLIDLSQTSVASGLEVGFFKPQTEIPREFYAEYPIQLSVSGKYHEFGAFVSGLAALPRIVTLQDIKINPIDKEAVGGELKMDLTAVTYRYLADSEIAANEAAANKPK